jgi:general secretion pathway protein H
MVKANHGFSLIELLVVILVISVAVGAVVLSVSTQDVTRQLKPDTVEFQLKFNRARDQAIISGRDLGLFMTANRYQWLQAEWQESEINNEPYLVWSVPEQGEFEAVELDELLSFELTLEQQSVVLAEALPDLQDESLDQELDPLIPLVVMQNDGESTPPFDLLLNYEQQPVWLIRSDGFHPVEAEVYGSDS